jgi:uncharacterized protein (DUF1015 family)
MMTLFNLDEPGMSIRPIHRLVHGIEGFDRARFLDAASEAFSTEEVQDLAAAGDALSRGSAGHIYVVYAEGRYTALRLRPGVDVGELIPGMQSTDWKSLDVSILHAALFERLLGIDAEAMEQQRNITYTVDPQLGVDAVDRGEEQALFLLNPTKAEQVRRVADHGERMPQKSTDFYPKLLTGLVSATLEIGND